MFGLDQAHGESAKAAHIFRAEAGRDAAAVFTVVPVDDGVTAILNGPMAAIHHEYAFRGSLLGRAAGDAVGNVEGDLAGLFHDGMPLDEESLADVRKVEVVIQFGGGPDLPGFDSSMLGLGRLQHVVRLVRISILEEQLDIVEKLRLVAFHGEQIVGFTL